MGFLDRFRPKSPLTGDAVCDALLKAAAKKDAETFCKLCEANAPTIRDSFKKWLTVPTGMRGDPAAIQRYLNGLMLVASAFQKAGDSTLMAMLTGPDDNPLVELKEEVEQAGRLLDGGHAAQAVERLDVLLAREFDMEGPGVDRLRAIALGRLGIGLYRMGDKARAVEVTRQALAICELLGDKEGVAAYTQNLAVIESPMTVAYQDTSGRDFEPGEPPEERMRYEVRGGEAVPPEAEALHQQGRAAGQRGDHDKALRLLSEASALAPCWPYPVYDRAFTHLLRQDWAAARADYERTIELAPRGFFKAHTAVDILRREAAGEFRPGLYLAYTTLELMPVEERREVLRQLVEKEPGFAPGWCDWVKFAGDPPERLAVIERGLAANPDLETKGMLKLNKALVLHAAGQLQSAIDLLRELASDPDSTTGVVVLAKDSLVRLGAGAV
jgi:tetratricopeptide (TPR) repeat protein